MKANPEETHDSPVRIYEGASLTVKGEVAANQADLVQDVTFKFYIDGKPNTDTDKTISMSEGTKGASGAVTVTHTLNAPVVPDDKDFYTLDYHVFYNVKNKAGDTEPRETFAVKKFEVLPRTAQLKVTAAADGSALGNFQFKVLQGGKQFGGIQSTFVVDTTNAKGDTIPSGSAEFNLDLKPGFIIVQMNPCEITEQTVTTGRKREAKGEIKFKACFVMPKQGNVQQWVNEPSENHGQTGLANEVVITVGVDGDEDRLLKIASDKTEVHFRVTFGPDDTEQVKKSARNDPAFPTKVVKVSDTDTTATIEEKTANTKYEGKVTLPGGTGSFKVQLGVAGGDTCLVEIAGSDKFLTDANILPDQTLRFENWRRIYYELMVNYSLTPHVFSSEYLDEEREVTKKEAEQGGRINLGYGATASGTYDSRFPQRNCLLWSTKLRMQDLGKHLFIEFEHAGTQVPLFDKSDATTVTRKFLGLPAESDNDPAYVLTGYNWRELPKEHSWFARNPGRTLYMTPCDAMMLWRKETKEPQAATKDYSGTLTTATDFIDMEETFGGRFVPVSGDDGNDSITEISWVADITKDAVGAPSLEFKETRFEKIGTYASTMEASITDLSYTSILVDFQIVGGKFSADGIAAYTAHIGNYLKTILSDPDSIIANGRKITLNITFPKDTGSGEDACVKALKDKFTEALASSGATLPHRGLDDKGAPRTGILFLHQITDDKTTSRRWRYKLPEFDQDGLPGPGSFVGPLVNSTQCPIKIDFSVQPHQSAIGAADGKLLAWVYRPPAGDVNLRRLILRSFAKINDDKRIAPGHSDGNPGDCLATGDVLCDACAAFGRSVRLDLIP
ncbi:MAG TPA: hypothetical protein VGK48_17130 [Terriglobia bacterium]|jgi:hypothetical protein